MATFFDDHSYLFWLCNNGNHGWTRRVWHSDAASDFSSCQSRAIKAIEQTIGGMNYSKDNELLGQYKNS